MKIFFRYLFIRLMIPFVVCLLSCTLIWIMADLYGNMDDFLEHKINVPLILHFYSLQIPSMLVQALPATMLFSTLWTLLSLNRRCELVAFQSGGVAPIWLFSPFLLFAFIWMLILLFDLNWPVARAQVDRERLLQQVKGQNARRNVFINLPYVDRVNRRVWFFESLDTNQNTAKGVELLQRDADGHDMVKYTAGEAKWNGEFWELSDVRKIVFDVNGGVQDQKSYAELDLPDITTPPQQFSLIVSQAEQLTVSQLSQYIATSPSSQSNLAQYRTEWWYRVLYPLSLIVLMLYALLLQGAHTDRRNALGGVLIAILVLLFFIIFMHVFMALGSHDRLPPFVAVVITPLIFGGIGLYLLARSNGWWGQLLEIGKRWWTQWGADRLEERDEAAG